MKRTARPSVDPPKLVELEHPYAELLARGNREYATKPEETELFCRTRGLQAPNPRGASPVLPTAVAAAAVLALGVGIFWPRERVANSGVDVSAEPLAMPEGVTTEARGIAPPAVKRNTAAPSEKTEANRDAPREHARTSASTETAREETRALPSPPASSVETTLVPAPEATSQDCRELARSGKPREAEACYLTRSSGSGLDAETALLEVARLQRDVLGDPSGALGTLEHYRARFPNGALRREADVAHVGMLTRLGRPQDALAETQKLLDSPNGGERAFELRLLRGNIYKKNLKNPALAAREYEAAERLDGASSEASYLLGTTLEELGDAKGAAAAYRRYLDRAPNGKRAADVQRRIGKLSP